MPQTAMKMPAYTTPGALPVAEAAIAMTKPTRIAHMGTKMYTQREAPRLTARSDSQQSRMAKTAAET
jgi:hypothetical protein